MARQWILLGSSVVWVGLVAILLIGNALVSHAAGVSARNPLTTTTPTPDGASALAEADPTAHWTASQQSFESRYPFGFTFEIALESDAAEVTRASVIWSHVPGTKRSRPAEYDPARGLWVVVWVPNVRDAIPPWLSITYYWEASDAEEHTFQSEPVTVEYADNVREWVRAESDDVIVYTLGLGADVAEEAIEAMAAQRETYRAAWGELLPYTPRVILYGERSAWLEWQLGTRDMTTIGTTRSDWGATVQVLSGGSGHDLVWGTVLHEVAHLYQSEFVGALPVTWFMEGNATFFELSHQYDYEGTVRALAARDELPALLQGTGPGLSTRRGYSIGYTFFVWLVENYGIEGHRELMHLLGTGIARNGALETVTGLTSEEIESRWRVWLGASPHAPTLAPSPTYLFFPSPTPFVPGASSGG